MNTKDGRTHQHVEDRVVLHNLYVSPNQRLFTSAHRQDELHDTHAHPPARASPLVLPPEARNLNLSGARRGKGGGASGAGAACVGAPSPAIAAIVRH